MIKIIAGKYGSRTLRTLEGDNTRPTSSKTRGAIFSRIGPFFSGGNSLDLFAGSGAFSFEALSRGIEKVYLADNNRDAIKIIKKNSEELGAEINLFNSDYISVLKKLSDIKFKIIFLDPPYKLHVIENIIRYINDNNMLEDKGVIVVETLKDYQLEEKICKIEKEKEVIYGVSKISYYKWSE